MSEFHNETYIPLPERVTIVEESRTRRKKLMSHLTQKSVLTYPGFKGAPSELPDGPKRKK